MLLLQVHRLLMQHGMCIQPLQQCIEDVWERWLTNKMLIDVDKAHTHAEICHGPQLRALQALQGLPGWSMNSLAQPQCTGQQLWY